MTKFQLRPFLTKEKRKYMAETSINLKHWLRENLAH